MFFKKRGRKDVGLEGSRGIEDLERVGRRKTIIRMYYMKKKLFSVREKKKKDFRTSQGESELELLRRDFDKNVNLGIRRKRDEPF